MARTRRTGVEAGIPENINVPEGLIAPEGMKSQALLETLGFDTRNANLTAAVKDKLAAMSARGAAMTPDALDEEDILVPTAGRVPWLQDGWQKPDSLKQAREDLAEAERLLDKIQNDPPMMPDGISKEDWRAAREFTKKAAEGKRDEALAKLSGHDITAEHMGELERHQPSKRATPGTIYTAELPGPHIPVNSARLIDSMTLRQLDGEAYRNGRKALDLRSNSVASDSGMHILTIEKIDFYPMTPAEIKEEMIRASRRGERVDEAMAAHMAITRRTSRDPGRLGLIARVSIHPGLTSPDRRIMDTLSIDMSFWTDHGLSEEAVAGYCKEHRVSATGHVLLMSLQLDDAAPEDVEHVAALNEILMECERTGEPVVAAMDRAGVDPDKNIPLAFQVSNEEMSFGA